MKFSSALKWFLFERRKVVGVALLCNTIELKIRATFSSNQKVKPKLKPTVPRSRSFSRASR